MPRLGLISDTHGTLDPQVVAHFDGVDHIVHAGDVGGPGLLHRLESVAPVTAVLGNTDVYPGWQETELIEVGGHRILVQHIVEPGRLSHEFRQRIRRDRPEVVVFGHTHRPAQEPRDGVLFVNPGSASQGRGGHGRSVALLSWPGDAQFPTVEFITLGR